jgi:hypothetical protein
VHTDGFKLDEQEISRRAMEGWHRRAQKEDGSRSVAGPCTGKWWMAKRQHVSGRGGAL